MKNLNLRFKKAMAIVINVISIIVMVIGMILEVAVLCFIFYVFCTQTHDFALQVTESERKFLFEILMAPCIPMIIGSFGYLKIQEFLEKIKLSR